MTVDSTATAPPTARVLARLSLRAGTQRRGVAVVVGAESIGGDEVPGPSAVRVHAGHADILREQILATRSPTP